MTKNVYELIREIDDEIDTLIDLIKTTKNNGVRNWAMKTLDRLIEERIKLMNWALKK